MARFAIEHLSGDQLLEAWPVVRLAQAHANCDWWMSDAAAPDRLPPPQIGRAHV